MFALKLSTFKTVFRHSVFPSRKCKLEWHFLLGGQKLPSSHSLMNKSWVVENVQSRCNKIHLEESWDMVNNPCVGGITEIGSEIIVLY